MSNSCENKPKSNGGFTGFLKNTFFILLIVSFVPSLISTFKGVFDDIFYPKTQVGYLHIAGVIRDSLSYTKRLEEFAKNSSIKALFVRIDSPGGLPGSSQAIFNELLKFKKKKPVVVLVDNVCASGGYYIAAAASKIIANPSALIGSIGVLAVIPNVKELLNTWHIKVNHVQSGAYKTAGSPHKDLSEAEQEYLQETSDIIYDQFIKDVAQQRKLSEKESKKWADGKVYPGSKALTLGLIDQLGSYSDAVEAIKKLANIKEEIKFVSLKKSSGGLMKLLMGDEDFSELSDFSETASSFFSKVATQCYEQHLMQKATITL